VDARVVGELWMKGRGQEVVLADEYGPAVHPGEHLDIGPRPAEARRRNIRYVP